MHTLRWGILGTARINRSIIPPLHASSRNEVAAVASRSRDRAEAFAEQWEIPTIHTSYEALLADPSIDVIYNPLPNHLHAEWTVKAAQAGKHVLCEKPIALTVAELDAVAEAAKQAGVVVTEAFMYRHQARTLKVKALVDDGHIGEVHVIRGAFTFTLGPQHKTRLDPAMGGGSLWDVGCYPVSYARFITGSEPQSVFAQQVVSDSGVDLTFTGQLRFPDGILAQFDSGFRSSFRMYMEIVGSTGTLFIPKAFKSEPLSTIHIRRNFDSDIVTVTDAEHLYLAEIEDLAEAILTGNTPRVSLAESRANTQTITALYASAQTNQPVHL